MTPEQRAKAAQRGLLKHARIARSISTARPLNPSWAHWGRPVQRP
ncbi:hypothetical protein OG223_36655 [Streptomyces sp. NBC_01478]|nr:hypothetical protein [Streptomyces sp. NBC_01478]